MWGFFPHYAMNRKISVKLHMPNLLQLHLYSCSFIMIRVTSYKNYADSCEEHRRQEYHTNSKKMHVAEWPSRESQSCLFDMQITYSHRAILITKLGRIERIIFFSMLYLQTAGVEGLVASFIKHPLACPGQFCVTKFMKWLQVIFRKSFAQVAHLATTFNTAMCASSK